MSRILERQVTEHITTDSSCVTKASYCAAERTLDVVFPSGRVYRYLDVNDTDWLHLLLTGETDGSLGAQFNKWIRDRYEFVELSYAG